jgi:AcrR family transcriptional regulator
LNEFNDIRSFRSFCSGEDRMGPSDTKRAAVLHAALGLFLKHGLRGTSMEAIAAAAGIAKPTLYAYYPQKQAVFRAVAEHVIESWRTAAVARLPGDGAPAQRIAAALVAREKSALGLRLASPHAAELFGPDGAAGDLMQAYETALTAAIEAELAAARRETPRLVAQLLLAAAEGIGRRATAPAELGPPLRLLCARLIGLETQGSDPTRRTS